MTRPDDATIERLLEAAKAVRVHAYVPYSHFAVGAALIAGGDVFTGVNIENASYPMSVCAERNAVAAAVTAGRAQINAIAVVADASVITPPCGGCRQVLLEFGPHMTVVCARIDGGREEWTLDELLPHAFTFER